MKFKIVNHWSKETGRFLGYSFRWYPCCFLPFYWHEIHKSSNDTKLYEDIREVEHDICFILKMQGVLGKADKFD